MKTNSFGLLPTMEDFEFKEKPFYNEGDLTQLITNSFNKLGIYVTYTIARKVLFAIVLSRFHCLNEHLKSMLDRVHPNYSTTYTLSSGTKINKHLK